MPIDLNAAMQKYATVTPQMANVWQQRATQAAQKWEANAKSPQTEQYWAQRVVEAAQNQARLRGLQNVTAADYSAGVQAGIQAYQNKVSTIAPQKWMNKFAPYAQIIDQVVATLPPKTTDVATNVMNRVVPIAVSLRQAKLQGVVARAGIGTPAPPALGPTPGPTPGFRSPFTR